MTQQQAPAVYRKIPVYRDWTQIPIPGFLKIKYKYFSGFWQITMFSKTFFDFSQEFLCSMKIIGLSQDCPAVRKYIRICLSIVNTFIILIVMTKKGFLAACVCLGAQSIEHLSSRTQTYIQKPKQL